MVTIQVLLLIDQHRQKTTWFLFKPIVYLAALENGYSPVTKVLDAPFVIDDYSKDGIWRPTNYGDKFYGLSTLRLGMKSLEI